MAECPESMIFVTVILTGSALYAVCFSKRLHEVHILMESLSVITSNIRL